MSKVFNTTAVCIPEEHYMVNIEQRLQEIKALVDDEKYFTINRARQYGKTTTLIALKRLLEAEYYVILMDFQTFGSADFANENVFALSFCNSFLRLFRKCKPVLNRELEETLKVLTAHVENRHEYFTLKPLFEGLGDICEFADKPVVLMIDEVDSASNNQVFLDFLGQLRAQYINRFQQTAFKSVILAGVYDIKNLRHKIRPDKEHKYNSPWNIAADFNVDMSFSQSEIAGMLREYEADYHTGMKIDDISEMLYQYTSGYPFLVSRLCQILDENIGTSTGEASKKKVWTKDGFHAAVRILLAEKNTLFESLSEKLSRYPELNDMLQSLLFTGKAIAYNYYEPSISVATMFGFVKNDHGVLAIANRIFETWLYNLYLSTSEMQKQQIYSDALMDKNQFLVNGHLNMRMILERFVVHFHDLYGNSTEKFIEQEARKYFLLYLRPIINGTGNYYIEAETREQKRTDVIVDYRGEQYIIEMKIWRGQEYNARGEKQLSEYLDSYHVNQGYLISFNFNQKKEIGVHEILFEDKKIIEAVV